MRALGRVLFGRREYIVYANWDEEAHVWVATSEDVPGLVTESATIEALTKKLRSLIPELLELNSTKHRKRVPYQLCIHEVAHA